MNNIARRLSLVSIFLIIILLATSSSCALQGKELKQSVPQQDTTINYKKIINDFIISIGEKSNDSITIYINKLLEGFELSDTTKLARYQRAFITSTLFNHFYDSGIMGQEEVAVNLAQDWILNDKIELPNSDDKFLIRMFVETNKRSLVGMDAPDMNLIDTSGNRVALSSLKYSYSIIYFYTDDCPTCSIETSKLVDFVNQYSYAPINIYAVYTQDNVSKWKSYINENFADIYNPFAKWVNVYDPTAESGFHMLYNVISTPQMFLIDEDHKIVGRNLNVTALEQLLNSINESKEFGIKFHESIFSSIQDTTTLKNEIDKYYINMFKGDMESDSDFFKKMFKELFEYFSNHQNHILNYGAKYIAQKYIFPHTSFWNNTLFINRIIEWLDIYNMNTLGEIATNLYLEDMGGSPIDIHSINSEYKLLYFFSPDCGLCEHVSKELYAHYSQFKDKISIEFIAINTTKDYNRWIKYITDNNFLDWTNIWAGENNRDIYDNYYIPGLPTIYLLKENIVIAKDINDIDVKQILEIINQQ